MSLTIKQAFEALSDACANGMKNPFFVMRRLKESFADVASKVVDASGDKVTVTQTLTEGTEIGSIKVNNNTTKLYAPASAGIDYSETEQDTGLKWIDGKNIYQKSFKITSLTAGANTISHSISNVNEVIHGDGIFFTSEDSSPIPNGNTGDGNIRLYDMSATSFKINIGSVLVTYLNHVVITLQYTKTESE